MGSISIQLSFFTNHRNIDTITTTIAAMKNLQTPFIGLLALASKALGQIVNCDGNQSPDWDACAPSRL